MTGAVIIGHRTHFDVIASKFGATGQEGCGNERAGKRCGGTENGDVTHGTHLHL
jgi:hypothetical protein